LTPRPTTITEFGAVFDMDMSAYNEHVGGVNPGNGSVAGGFMFAGSGAPAAGLGSNGDYYLRSDGGSSTHIYFKSSGSWAGII